ncbi:hypothetical protein TWF730_006795 [Orbilia blumenaviensis]|uniref:F-box domain-containing protein n=1 Tax=Orbilia blumenaviensis TaxID=1796055 RepID=A0AAV9VFB3_9PEZI
MQLLPTTNITTLPIELRIKILHHLPSPSSLLSAILSTRSLHTAYKESRTSITTSVLQNSTSENSVYCNFLTYALIVFHQKHYITLDRLHRFLRSYLEFANPGCNNSSSSSNSKDEGTGGGGPEDIVPWETCPPPNFYKLRPQVYRSIFQWATKFCTLKLQTSPKYSGPMSITTPTPLEIARAARAFYQYFLYTVISTDVFFHSEDVDNMGRPITGKPGVESMAAFVESVGYRDQKVIQWFLRDWMVGGVVRELLGKCVKDEKNPVRRETGVWEVSFSTLAHKLDEASQALITRLGPIGLWNFAYESTYDEQFKIYCHAPAALDRDSFWSWDVVQAERKEAKSYDPSLRICVNEVEIGEDGLFEWWTEREGDIIREGILWDERRLEGMGLRRPVVRGGVEVQWYKKDTKWKNKELAMGECDCYW